MKVAILSESPADEAAVLVLVEAILGEPVLPAEGLRHPVGWPSVLQLLPSIIKGIHYHHPQVQGLVAVADSNHSLVHAGPLDQPCEDSQNCRLCLLRRVLERAFRDLRPLPGRNPLKVAIGLAVPVIEAWYLCGKDPNVSEGAWVRGMKARSCPYTKQGLKQLAYGTDRPGLALETGRAVEEARRVARNLGLLEEKFPVGFGALAQAVRRWKQGPAGE